MARKPPPRPARPPEIEHRDELVAEHVDTQRLRRRPGLAAGPQPQPERGAPQDDQVTISSRNAMITSDDRLVQSARSTPATSETKNDVLLLDLAEPVAQRAES